MVLGSLLLLACAHFPVNAPLDRCDPAYGYRVSATSGDTDDSQELLLIVNFGDDATSVDCQDTEVVLSSGAEANASSVPPRSAVILRGG